MTAKGKYVVDPRPPRVDWERVRNGPSARDLREIPATTEADWKNAELLIPIDEETYREFRAFMQERRRKRPGTGEPRP